MLVRTYLRDLIHRCWSEKRSFQAEAGVDLDIGLRGHDAVGR